MVRRNPDIAKLIGGYLFPEINKRRQAYLRANPDAKIVSLGIGDTTEPIPHAAVDGFVEASKNLGNSASYTGYGPEKGNPNLRKNIAERIYNDLIDADDIFISDGAKCDLGRLQMLFGRGVTTALQDPAYPVYVDSTVIAGCTGSYNPQALGYQGIVYLPCLPGNDFFPDLARSPRTDLIFFCSPNNPTGAVATREQLRELVLHARKRRSLIVFDNAYSAFIQDPALPKSIYEIPEAREVAIEIGSFSKLAGFTGVRLGWSIVPKELCYEDGSSVKADWERVTSTIFNGACNIAQAGGAALLTDKGLEQTQMVIEYYRQNAHILKGVIEKAGLDVFGGTHAPYLWVRIPAKTSWEAFEWLLEKAQLITTPGLGFGPSGEGFVRMSALGKREDINEAARRLQKLFGEKNK